MARNDNGFLPERPQNAELYTAHAPIPLPAGFPLLGAGSLLLAEFKARRGKAP
ncbi:MAG: hypothetical protein AAFW64_07960 [Pseudomonadota bacterium]